VGTGRASPFFCSCLCSLWLSAWKKFLHDHKRPRCPEFNPMNDFVSHVIAIVWTPIFVAIFIAILASALWPGNREKLDDAARMPLRED
jgi:cytochrome c oxidase cbb3-type subunit IV